MRIIKSPQEIQTFLKEKKSPQTLPASWIITPNFAWREFFVNVHDEPSLNVLLNIAYLANRLQVLRDTVFNRPVSITSGWRSPKRNATLIKMYDEMIEKGQKPSFNRPAENSFHLYGMAADIVVRDVAPSAVQEVLKNWQGGLGKGHNFTHLDTRANRITFNY